MKTRTTLDRLRDVVLILVAGATLARMIPPLFAAWDATKPPTNGALVSADIRANWTSIQNAIGNPDTVPLSIVASQFAAAPTYKPGTDTGYDATVNGLLAASVDTTQRANSGTGETTLSTYSLPANALATNGRMVHVRFWGSDAATGNTKTLKVYFGATSITMWATAVSGGNWEAEAFIVRTGAATQKMEARGSFAGTSGFATQLNAAPAETLSGAVTIKTTGQSNAASSDILQENFYVEVIGS